MNIISNNLVFTFESEQYNVPIAYPWKVYKGNTIKSEPFEDNIDKSVGKLNYITYHITERCNLDCTYCFEKGKSQCNSYLGSIDDLIKFIKNNNIVDLNVRFFGGEPLLEAKFIESCLSKIKSELIDKEYVNSVKYNVFTNGTIINDKILELLKKYNFFVFLSIDGYKELHDKNRFMKNKMGTYDIVLNNISLFKKSVDNNIIVRSIIDPSHKTISIANIAREMYNNGINLISIEFPWVEKDSNFALNIEKSKIIKNSIINYAKEYINSIKNNDYSIIGVAPFSQIVHMLIKKENFLTSRACGAGCEGISIDINGDIYPCHAFVNIDEYKLGNIIDGITNLDVSSIFYNYSCDTVPKCKECAIRYFCTRRCPADSLFFNGSIYEPNSYRCELQKQIIKASFYIFYNLKQLPLQLRVISLLYNKAYEFYEYA